MCFDGALGDVQVASDFSVVTSLEKQIDNLAFAGGHLFDLLFHKVLHLTDAHRSRQVALKPCAPRRIWIRVLCVSFCKQLAKTPRSYVKLV